MDWLASTAARRTDPLALWPDARSVIMLGLNYGPDGDPLAILMQRDRGAISVYAQGDDYHDLIKAKLKAIARWLVGQCGRRREGVRRHRRRDGEAARGVRRSRLAGQAHQSRVAPAWLVAVSRRDLHDARTCAGRARNRSLRQVPGLPRYLPDQCVSGALPARCAALHFVSDDRAQGSDPARIPRKTGQPHLWLRRLPRGVPVEQVRAGRTRSEAFCAGSAARTEAPRSSRGSTTRHSARCFPSRRSSAPGATASCAMWRSRSGIQAMRRWPPRPSDCSTMLRRWCAAQPFGRWARLDPARLAALAGKRTRARPMKRCGTNGARGVT